MVVAAVSRASPLTSIRKLFAPEDAGWRGKASRRRQIMGVPAREANVLCKVALDLSRTGAILNRAMKADAEQTIVGHI